MTGIKIRITAATVALVILFASVTSVTVASTKSDTKNRVRPASSNMLLFLDMSNRVAEVNKNATIANEICKNGREFTIEERAVKTVADMTLNEKVAQMFLAYIPSKNAASFEKKYQFGGYLLFASDFSNSNIKKKQKDIKSYQNNAKINMLIAVDEEGGGVNRVSVYKAFRSVPFSSPQRIYNSGKMTAIKNDTKNKCKFLKSIGINTNLAPVADTPYKKTDFIYGRAFSTDEKKNAKYIETVVKTMNSENVISTLKHFPGYGGNGDTHKEIMVDKRKKSTFENRDLIPFESGIKNGAPMIMVSHNIVKSFDKKYPASLSVKIHKYIRNNLKYDGVIISDGLDMKGVTDFAGGSGKTAVAAVKAGNDMICADDPVNQLKAVVNAVKKGKISEKQIDESVERILIMKMNYNIMM